MKELMVVAIGGNSIIKDNASQSIEHQAQAVKAVAESVLEMLASDYDIVLTHGNGPRWGWICAAPKSPTSGKGCR
jgi:carbamate kinase